jgi:alkanesulfonate monooxygenase SsuD/methylene tetrahydromethanopterin reductase-like flavin-dependent oxidoreductase (luciferase family)
MDERLRAMVEIWTKDEAEFHGKYVDFDPIYSWPKPLTEPHTPVFIGGGPANFTRITDLGAGWLSLSPSADALAGDLAKLREVAGRDVPVIASHIGKVTADALAGYRDLGIEHVTVELPTQPRDETLRRLDTLHAEYAKLS